MTADETARIEQACARLIARYANLNDAGDWDAVAALYAPDGRMARPTAPDAWIVGRDAIRAAFLARPARITRHLCANIVVDVLDADTAVAESAVALFVADAPVRVGGFHDRLVRIGDHWLFAERRGYLTF
ncbi:hypothetical protein GCM10011380_29490 [Sphingomonas metalli]|uniref:SnoaL-like domain-containing protein n=1 Tax=Sphingomonas metalli TaxID=1779358 RepID=A0A916TBF8_9SPHN|nr:nuclear transport factor 2 family protein [Sphingomonas metalli]GGB38193.1 hypothetical protein GCM10011380_29490 [Sphingomonas metalli]